MILYSLRLSQRIHFVTCCLEVAYSSVRPPVWSHAKSISMIQLFSLGGGDFYSTVIKSLVALPKTRTRPCASTHFTSLYCGGMPRLIKVLPSHWCGLCRNISSFMRNVVASPFADKTLPHLARFSILCQYPYISCVPLNILSTYSLQKHALYL